MSPRSLSHCLALPLLILAALVIPLWVAFFRAKRHVEAVTSGRGDIEASVTALGTLQPRLYVDVAAQVSAEIHRIAVAPGSVMKKGHLLMEIDLAVQQAKVDTDRSALDSLCGQLDEARAISGLAWTGTAC